MKKVILRIAVLLVIFIGGVIGFSQILNQQNTEHSRDMEQASLPVLCIENNGYKINQMFGYVEEIDQTTLRSGLVPLTTNREISVSVQNFENKIDRVAYEVTSLTDGSIIENAKVSNFKEDGSYQTAVFSIQQPILMNQEYGLKFTVHTMGKDIFYYTRIVQRSSLNTVQYLEFAYNFYELCLNKEAAASLNMYLETDENSVNNSYTTVDIHSSFDQVTWGDLDPTICRKAVATIKEINETTGSIEMEYMISAMDESGETEYYYVTDFLRMRYYQSRIMLLDFERNAQQIYTANEESVKTKGIEVGVAGKDMQFLTNESNTIVAFVQAGELWTYNRNADKLNRVFSMRGMEAGVNRDNVSQRGIKIIRVEEGGDIHFAVYGYMSADEHEGQIGIAVWNYSSERNCIEENLFIPCTSSYEYIHQDMEKLSYVTRDENLFLYLNETVYKVNLMNMTYEVILDQINPDCFLASDDQCQIAWMDEMSEYGSSSVTVMDLESGSVRRHTAENGTKIKALGFVNDDFIYGIALDGDIVTDVSGNTIFAMSQLYIENLDGQIMKEYQIEGVWVYEISIKEGLIELCRVVRTEYGFEVTTTDNIMNNQKDTENKVVSRMSYTSRRGTILTLVMPQVITNRTPLINNSKIVEKDTQRSVVLEEQINETKIMYYVYAKGCLQGVYVHPAKAIAAADEMVGVVLNTRQQYIWERGNSQTENELENADIPAVFLSGTMVEQTLTDGLGDLGDVMNLTGCTLEQILYQLSEDRAVLARKPDGTTALIVGYDRYNTLLYDFSTGEHYYYGINDSTELFMQGGNVFLSYIEKPTAVTKG